MKSNHKCSARGRHLIPCDADAVYICTAKDGREQWFSCEAHSQIEIGRRDLLVNWLAWIDQEMRADIAAQALQE